MKRQISALLGALGRVLQTWRLPATVVVLYTVFAVAAQIQVALATDNQSTTKSYQVSTRGFGVKVGDEVFDVPAWRDSLGTDSLLVQYGTFTLGSSPDTIGFAVEGAQSFSGAPTAWIERVGPASEDTLYAPVLKSASAGSLFVDMAYVTDDSVGRVARGTINWFAVGRRPVP